jgi:hypothetical protein
MSGRLRFDASLDVTDASNALAEIRLYGSCKHGRFTRIWFPARCS